MRDRQRIAIVGCGMAGTMAAALLARVGHAVTLFERAPSVGPVGAGLLLQPSGQAVLRRAGLLDDAIRDAEPIDQMHAVTHTGRTLVRLVYTDLSPDCRAYGVHRSELFSTLHAAAASAGAAITLGREIVGHESTPDTIHLTDLAGQTHGPFDAALACDGGRSALRRSSAIPCRVHQYPHGAMWITGPCSAVRRHLHQITRGTHVLCGLLPTGNDRASFFWGLPARDFDSTRHAGFDSLKRRILSICPQAAELLEGVTSFDRATFATYHHVAMPQWHAGRLIFLGDAAHATSPHLGQGVNLALMDAEALATAVAHEPDWPAAFAAYERARRRHVTFYSRLTCCLSPFFQSDGVIRGWGRDAFLPLLPKIPWVRRQMLRTLAGDKPGWLS